MLLNEVKISLGLTSNTHNDQIQAHIDAALEDMKRCGVVDGTETEDEIVGLRRSAIYMFVKSKFGLDIDTLENEYFARSYRQIVCDLINSNDTVH